MKISMKLFYQYMVIFLNVSLTSNHLYPLQAANCCRNSRLVVDEEDYGKFRIERVNPYSAELCLFKPWRPKGYFQFDIIINDLVSSF